jgi:hypothetical protein
MDNYLSALLTDFQYIFLLSGSILIYLFILFRIHLRKKELTHRYEKERHTMMMILACQIPHAEIIFMDRLKLMEKILQELPINTNKTTEILISLILKCSGGIYPYDWEVNWDFLERNRADLVFGYDQFMKIMEPVITIDFQIDDIYHWDIVSKLFWEYYRPFNKILLEYKWITQKIAQCLEIRLNTQYTLLL